METGNSVEVKQYIFNPGIFDLGFLHLVSKEVQSDVFNMSIDHV